MPPDKYAYPDLKRLSSQACEAFLDRGFTSRLFTHIHELIEEVVNHLIIVKLLLLFKLQYNDVMAKSHITTCGALLHIYFNVLYLFNALSLENRCIYSWLKVSSVLYNGNN